MRFQTDYFCLKLLSSSSWGCELKYVIWDWKSAEFWSSSSWGCELKYSMAIEAVLMRCHPLREDVSWNSDSAVALHIAIVILFVRMWVEISCVSAQGFMWKSSSSWGCELKFSFKFRCDIESVVILFVRMWVEIDGKYVNFERFLGHPLREDVSWNVCIFRKILVSCQSSSSWGCELKYTSVGGRSWRSRHPLREDVSWNTILQACNKRIMVILFVRMWVEITLWAISLHLL